MNATERLLYWMRERETIRQRRAQGLPAPWSSDPILNNWSFCNVRREDDRVTRFIAALWRDAYANDKDLSFAITVARFLNWPPTLSELGYPVPWDHDRFLACLDARRTRGDQLFGAAYVIGTAGKKIDKIEYLADLFDRLWERRRHLRPRHDDSLLCFFARLENCRGVGSFMAAQVVADMKYVTPLCEARDWVTFAASGPGSRRGLNRMLGRPINSPWKEENWRRTLADLHARIMPTLESLGLGDLHAQDLQNCLCELDKFERVRLGEGKPKRRFLADVGGSEGVVK